ncbi:HD-GYP domain-containing protein [Legionella micdadei]|uniref:HDIG domain-containing protein n=1 Tax=Legionella micdadei TaxID=451 RepID=A0A098GKD2_LEGMI|nr:HD-GYP domain-containing protein [Legionella micdadei]ARG96651.1 HDIG domain-containing protein [Legionella micdadei]KTD26314.1 metal dependent phosphohydrolase [Legionella micdadei]NSL19111.1 HD-GYP domain-containing protein [Legionella micdadei]CEG61976.1 protein of unknown function [Metal-dependent phosphohydrolase, HD subdomain] [Legionella micdadei]SCY67948.1 HDIG domain-containing protein [Legionella micdadei]
MNNKKLTYNEKSLLRLYSAHSALFILTSAEHIASYLERLLNTVPGVLESEVCLIKSMERAEKELYSKFIGKIDLKQGKFNLHDFFNLCESLEEKEIQVYPLITKDIFYGLIALKISDFEQFSLFDPVVNSFAISTSIIFENIFQKYELEKTNKELLLHREHLSELVKLKTQSLEHAKIKLQSMLDKTVESLASVSELRDPFTAGHQYRVAKLAEEIANRFGVSPKIKHEIYLGALIHDIGKTRIPMEILVYPAKLSQLEYDFIKQHPEMGYQIAKKASFSKTITNIVLYHHERLDGSGYPYGLKDKEIPLETKIVSVADVFEAMSSHRPYRPKHTIEETLAELINGSGKLYEPSVVECCIELITKQHLELPTPPYERLNQSMYPSDK